MITVDKSACGYSLELGTKIISVVALVYCVALGVGRRSLDSYGGDLLGLMFFTLELSVAVATVLLIVGVFFKRMEPTFVKLWVVIYFVLLLVHGGTIVLLLTAKTLDWVFLATVVVYMLVQVYFLIVVYSYSKTLV